MAGKPAINKTLKQVERAIFVLGKDMEEKGAGADKIKSFSQLVGTYNKLLVTRATLNRHPAYR